MKWRLGALGAVCIAALAIPTYNANSGEYTKRAPDPAPAPAPMAQTAQPAAPQPAEVREAYKALAAKDYAGLLSRTEKALSKSDLGLDDKTTLRIIRAGAYSEQQHVDKAIAELTTAESLDPTSGRPAGQLAYLFRQQKKYEEAAAAYDRALGKSFPSPFALESVKLEHGWFLATCPDGKYRDGHRAIQYAEQALKSLLTEKIEPLTGAMRSLRIFEVLAAGHAETGNFDKAIAAASLASNFRSSLKGVMPDVEYAKKGFDQRAAGYKARKPWRESGG